MSSGNLEICTLGFTDEGITDCLKRQDCQYDEEGNIILCDDCPQKKAWKKMLENNPS